MSRTVMMNPKYEHLRDFVVQVPDVMDAEGTYIYGGRRNLIKMFTAPDGTRLNVKRYQKPSLPNNIIYSTGLRKPKGQRAFCYPPILLEKGIETPEAVAYIEERHCGLLGHAWLFTIQCPYNHRLYEMGDAAPEQYEPMARSLAAFCAHMHDSEVLHLDFSPGNVLWDFSESPDNPGNPEDPDIPESPDTPGSLAFSIVDINRMHFGPVSMEMGCRSFARLWGPKAFIVLLAREYAKWRGFDPTICETITLKHRAKFWKHYQKKREIEFKLEL